MQRRTFLSSVVTASMIAVPGCMSTHSAPKVTDYSFTKVSSSETPDEPQVVQVKDGSLMVRGTVTVANGCQSIRVGIVPKYMDAGETIKTKIEVYDAGGDMCTQALQDVGYELVVSFVGSAPRVVELTQGGQNSGVYSLSVPKAGSE